MNASVLVNGLSVSNTTYTPSDDITVTSVTFYPPTNFNYTGYANITVLNTDGGYATAVNALYITEDCPVAGYIGRGENCTQCPTGALCPGGNRVWPILGWYVSHCMIVMSCVLDAFLQLTECTRAQHLNA